MPVAQRQPSNTAFSAQPSPANLTAQAARAQAAPARRENAPGAPPERRPSARPELQARREAQMAALLCFIALIALAATVGFTVLMGHIRVVEQGNRHAKLSAMLRHEQDKAEAWKDRQARLYTAGNIEQKAQAYGMTHPDNKDMVTIP